MDEKTLQDILALNYGIESPSLEFLREGGTTTYKAAPLHILSMEGLSICLRLLDLLFRIQQDSLHLL